ncbi:pectate lyase 1 [Herrania umbratica]|uniref:Pectate lyase n=1 Tax=Herrania umbratica TaxID=108875 RepID=A0A6J1B875_9ROSI|nr:pectate lyase 1 [Herrania umbratica]
MATSWCFTLAIFVVILLASPNASLATMNVIDKCWRGNPRWRNQRQQLATCSVGFSGKMTNNIGKGVIRYKVTDPSDDPLNPKPGTLRHGATMIKGKVWITFKRNMHITLQRPLLISSFTAIDGRGVNVHVTGAGCLLVYQATDVIIHGLHIHHCKSQPPSSVMGPDSKVIPLGQMDGDAIRLVTAKKVWIDHNTLYDCQDGLLDVTLTSQINFRGATIAKFVKESYVNVGISTCGTGCSQGSLVAVLAPVDGDATSSMGSFNDC